MVEEMFHQTPEYFKQFSKKFIFFISESPPTITTEVIPNYAYGIYSDASDQCCGFDNFHYHIIAETTTDLGKQKKYTVPCLYSTYKHLLYNSTDHFFTGNLMKQLQSTTINSTHQWINNPILVYEDAYPLCVQCKNNITIPKLILCLLKLLIACLELLIVICVVTFVEYWIFY